MENSQKIDITALLQQGKKIQLKPQGYSMYPFIIPGRDWVVLDGKEIDNLCRGDVILYRRPEGILVLHRIWKIRPEGIYLVGDNQKKVEGPVAYTCVLGKMIATIHKGKERKVTKLEYRICSSLWLFLRPFRPFLSKFLAVFKRVLHLSSLL